MCFWLEDMPMNPQYALPGNRAGESMRCVQQQETVLGLSTHGTHPTDACPAGAACMLKHLQ